MTLTKQQQLVVLILQQLKLGKTNSQITSYINQANLSTPRGLTYSQRSLEQELFKLRNPKKNWKSALYVEMLLLLNTGVLTLKEITESLYSPRTVRINVL